MRQAASVGNGRARYGWDAPGVMLGMLAVGAGLVGAGTLLALFRPFPFSGPAGYVIAVAGAVPLLLGAAMLQYGMGGKLRTRDAILDLVDWRGDEAVLDVGTGAGLLVIGAAKRLTRGGRAVGIDIWASKDLSNNAMATTRRNAAVEGVKDRVEIRTGDATRLAFPDQAFDVVLSLLCLHNIEPKPGQAVACREIARVLKPGGKAVIGDYVPTRAYAAALREAGLDVRRSSPAFATAGALMWLLVANKPSTPLEQG